MAVFVSSQSQVISIPSVGSHHSVSSHIQSRQQLQQPTYVLIPAAQLSNVSETHVYGNTPTRSGNMGTLVVELFD